MTVMARLALGFSLVILMLIASMGMSVYQLQSLGANVDEFAQSRVPKLSLAGKVVETQLQSARQMRNILLLDSEAEIVSEIADVARNSTQVGEMLAAIAKHVDDDTERNLLKEVESARAKYDPLERKFLAFAKKGDYSSAKDELLSGVRGAQDRYIAAMNAFIEYQAVNSESDARAAQALQHNGRFVLLGLTALGVVIAVLAAVLITRSLTRSLGGEPAYAADVARSIAEGDLTVQVLTKHGDTSSLLSSIARMRESLSASVGEIRAAAVVVGSASEQIAKGNINLSTRTEEQASALGETAASMEELTTIVKQNTDNARQARTLADGASAVAAQGAGAMHEVVAAMQGISESSRKIAEIIGVIDAIAFQTNILALNAAVEAARAGEQGRGFAVVAAEVRSLAQRSSQASKEIRDLIQESAQRVDGGVKHAEGTSQTIEDIVASAKQVSGLITEIAEASGQQLAGIEQVNKAVTQMDSNTQQNAAIVEEAAAAAEHMSSQAEALVAAVSRFKVDVARPVARPMPISAAQPAPSPQSTLPAPRAAKPVAPAPAIAHNEEWEEF